MNQEDKSNYDDKMDEIIYQLEILILNAMIDALERLNEAEEDQMKYQTTITYI